MALKGHLKSTRVKAVLIVLFAPYVQRQQKVKTENYFTMKNGNTKKKYVREKLSNEETGEIYGKRKIDVEPVFGFLKANLGFTRMSVRGKSKVHNEMGFALMAVNLRKYTVTNNEN